MIMKYLFILATAALIFTGCTPMQCGIEETAFNQLSKSSKEKICTEYSRKQQEIEKIREENRRKEIELEEKKVAALYSGTGYGYNRQTRRILNVSIINGVFKPYGKPERIMPMEFTLADTEVKKVCFHSSRGSKACIWVSYQGDRILWNVVPDYGKTNLPSYVDRDLGREHYFDKGVTQTYARNWFKGSYQRIHINGKYRGADMDFKAYIAYQGLCQPVRIQYR